MINDSRGKKSKTLFFVAASWAVLLVKFALGGLTTPMGVMPLIGANEFGIATGVILAIWLGREWTEKVSRGSE